LARITIDVPTSELTADDSPIRIPLMQYRWVSRQCGCVYSAYKPAKLIVRRQIALRSEHFQDHLLVAPTTRPNSKSRTVFAASITKGGDADDSSNFSLERGDDNFTDETIRPTCSLHKVFKCVEKSTEYPAETPWWSILSNQLVKASYLQLSDRAIDDLQILKGAA